MTHALATRIVCAGCGQESPPDESHPFRCPASGKDDTDHVLTTVPDLARLAWPPPDDTSPYLQFRRSFHSWQLARAHGMEDERYCELVRDLDGRIATIEGHGFHETPFAHSGTLGSRLGLEGDLWVKDETGQVGRTHKARHLMAVLVHLEVVERLGLSSPADRIKRPLAIASCGNAALAAAVLARAAERSLQVFIPEWAHGSIVHRLQKLGASITMCPRVDGVAGDPTYHRFQEALCEGSIPFCCQGPDCGMNIDGGRTLGWEMASVLSTASAGINRLFIQVGGGALASATWRGLEEARALGAIAGPMPRLHCVQAAGAAPLIATWGRVQADIDEALQARSDGPLPIDPEARALTLKTVGAPLLEQFWASVATHRSRYMKPWPTEPTSVARGILDDETYDWLALVKAMVRSGGYPVAVSEEALRESERMAVKETEIAVDATGAAGLAGLLTLLREQASVIKSDSNAVIFTGVSPVTRIVRAALTQTRNAYKPMPADTDQLTELEPHLDAIREANLRHHLDLLREAAARGVQVIGFGELFVAPYFALGRQAFWRDLAEDALTGPTVTTLAPAARELGIIIVAPIYELDPQSGRRFNTAVVIDEQGQVLGRYRKTHIPCGGNEQGAFHETFYYDPSDGHLGESPANVSPNPYFPVFCTSVGRIGVAICYDRHFEGVIRSLAQGRAELIFCPSITFGDRSRAMWDHEAITDATRHRVFIATSNRRGTEPPWTIPFFGASNFTSPEGPLPNLSNHENLIISDLDLDLLTTPDPSGWHLPTDPRPDIYT